MLMDKKCVAKLEREGKVEEVMEIKEPNQDL